MRNLRSLFLIAVMVFLVVVPLLNTDKYRLHVLTVVFYAIVLSASLRLTFITGQLSMAHVAFLGLGAYASAILTMRLHVSFWFALPIAGLITALIAAGLGYPTLRIKGLYFIIVTFAFTEIVSLVWIKWDGLFGGPSGIVNIPPPNGFSLPAIGQVDFQTKPAMYYLALVLAILAVFVMRRIDSSRLGLTFNAIKESDLLSECVGVNLMRYKMVAFCVSSFFAGLAGSFYAHYYYSISPYHFSQALGMDIVVWTVVGGIGSVFGPVLGAGLLVIVGEVLRSAGNWDLLVMGSLLIVVMLFLPGGIVDVPNRLAALRPRKVDLAGKRAVSRVVGKDVA